MKKINLIPVLLLALLLSSCNKKYSYIEVILDEDVFGEVSIKEKDAVIISAKNDTLAYLEAYQKFIISEQVNESLKERIGKTFTTPIEFKLLNDKGENIANTTFFSTKHEKEEEIKERIAIITNRSKEDAEIKEKERIEKLKAELIVDTVKVKEMEKYFTLVEDEFSNNNEIWYRPKSAPQYTNRNGIFCYFQTEKGIPKNLRFRVQYYADDWLFIRKVQFSIDGNAFEYIPSNVDTDHSGGKIWEWFDEKLTPSDKEMIYALANAENAKVKFIGSKYHNIKHVSNQQILDIKRTLELYEALGGKY